MTYETARDWTSPLFAWRSGARKDFEVKDAPLACRETGVSRRLMAHRLRRRPFRPSLSSKSFRAESPSSNQCQAAAFGRPSPVSYVSEPGQGLGRERSDDADRPEAVVPCSVQERCGKSDRIILAEGASPLSRRTSRITAGVRVNAGSGNGRFPNRAEILGILNNIILPVTAVFRLAPPRGIS